MKKQMLILAAGLLMGTAVCMAQNPQRGRADREKQTEQLAADLGLTEEQAKDFKAAMEEMRPARNNSGERPSREEMEKKRTEFDAKIKSILTEEQYAKYEELRKQNEANRKERAK